MPPIFYRAQARHAVIPHAPVRRRQKALVRKAACLGLRPHDGRHPSTVRALLRFSVLLHSFIVPSLAHPSERSRNLLNRACCRFCLACAALHESIDDGPTATDVRARASPRILGTYTVPTRRMLRAALPLACARVEPSLARFAHQPSHSSSPLRQGIGKVATC